MKQPIEFVRRGLVDAPTELYACPGCGTIYSPRVYAGENGDAHARAAASDCASCRPHEQVAATNSEMSAERRRKEIAAAKEVFDLDFCFSDRDGERCYPSVEDAADAGETGVFGSSFTPYRVDAGSVIEGILSDHHEDAAEEDLAGLGELMHAIETFNLLQKQGSYHMDNKRWQKIVQSETFAMIKPDATARGVEDAMIADIQAAGFRILRQERRRLERADAERLYEEHSRRDHFRDLVDYTISDDVILLHLESDADDTAAAFRALMGPTDRNVAEPHTLRAKYAVGYRENSIHGSDSPAAAISELAYFFPFLDRIDS